MNYGKVSKRINKMFDDGEIDDDFLSVKLSKATIDKLHDHQIIHVLNLLSIFKKNLVAIDGSGTGLGKTYTAIALCAELKLSPIIICPKSIISVWQQVCDYFGVKPLLITNVESVRGKKTKNNNKNNDKNNDQNDEENELGTLGKIVQQDPFVNYKWNIDVKRNIVIIDEAHKCKNPKTLNGKLLLSLKGIAKVLLLSATIADKPEYFAVFGYMLGFYSKLSQSRNWIEAIMREDENKLSKKVNALHERIYFKSPLKGSRMSYDDITTNKFKNVVTVDCYNISESNKKELDKCYDGIKSKLVDIQLMRQKIEEIKLEIVQDLIDKYYEQDKSIVVFVNYLASLYALSDWLTNNKIAFSTLHGLQSAEERGEEVLKFQQNESRVIICMMQVGGQSISLHDLTGKYPRVSLILPSFSSIDLLQALGRIDRVDVKSAILQKIILCDSPYEKLIADKIREKLKFNNMMGEGDNKMNNQLTAAFDNDLFI